MKNVHKKMMLGVSIVLIGLSATGLPLYAADQASPPNSLVVDESGKVGIGTETPTSKLSVIGASATSEDVQILVHNTDTSAPGVSKTLFIIKSDDGPAKFTMLPNTTGDAWAFNALANSFRISKQATGRREMEVFDTGNVTIFGNLTEGSSRTIKQDILGVDTRVVLDKVLTLPISTWAYNSDPDSTQHLG
ncbi:hypothetical protein N9H39_10095, partial [Gammaproteobacteria bacterium]|nr:hypothetical protein [Gammaproteobacteria bacterium]